MKAWVIRGSGRSNSFSAANEIICFNLASQMVEESDRNEFNLVANFIQS